MSPDEMRVTDIDHVVLIAEDLDETCRFYERALGMERVEEESMTTLRFGDRKLNVHADDGDFSLEAEHKAPGTEDLCFLTDVPIEAVVDHLRSAGVEIVEGPVERTGATSTLESVYVRDPDGNLVEIANEI